MYSDLACETKEGGGTRGRRCRAARSGGAFPELLLAILPLALLSGCGSVPTSINPVSWWHDLQGGAIAEQRPPPPGAADPYPNLATVPVRPAFTDAASRNRVTEGLVADRAHAQYEQARSPLPDPSSPSASPGLFGGGTPSPAAASASSGAKTPKAAMATLDAATAQPEPAEMRSRPPALTSSGRAPVGPVSGAPLAPPSAAQETPPGAAPPPLPTIPPPAPDLPGFPAAAGAPVPVSKLSVAAAPTVPGEVPIAFHPGAAKLDSVGITALRALAARRGNASIVVTGHGEAASAAPEAQSAALVLSLARAQAVAAALAEAGVPPAALVIDAQAAGRGAAVRLLN